MSVNDELKCTMHGCTLFWDYTELLMDAFYYSFSMDSMKLYIQSRRVAMKFFMVPSQQKIVLFFYFKLKSDCGLCAGSV